MFFQTRLRTVILSLGVLLLATGCANNETKSANDADKDAAMTASATVGETKPAAHEEAPKSPLEIPNPATIEFDKMSVKLDDKAKEFVAQMAAKAEGSKKLVIWGFCDRTEIGNAEKSAIARAVAVQKELKANGMKSPKVRIRYKTEVAGKHAVEVYFD